MSWRRGLMMALISTSLLGCGASTEDELRQWMTGQRAQTQPRVTPIPEPKQFKPESYSQAASLEPFSKEKLAQALKRDSAQSPANDALIAPELTRRKEALEGFPLDAVMMVGSINKAGQPVALIKVDNLLYQVKPGNYLGQNFGRVMKISETEITLREIVQDAVGEWIERPSSLQLQERSK